MRQSYEVQHLVGSGHLCIQSDPDLNRAILMVNSAAQEKPAPQEGFGLDASTAQYEYTLYPYQ